LQEKASKLTEIRPSTVREIVALPADGRRDAALIEFSSEGDLRQLWTLLAFVKLCPLSPMRRIYIDALFSGDTDPPVSKPAARENERNVFVRRIKDG
jgi:hypothetical protein